MSTIQYINETECMFKELYNGVIKPYLKDTNRCQILDKVDELKFIEFMKCNSRVYKELISLAKYDNLNIDDTIINNTFNNNNSYSDDE
jgi:hypothetical protein